MKLPSLSLKWKIAIWYAALLVTALAMTSAILVWRFGGIIYAQARERADATMSQVIEVANPSGGPTILQDVAANTPPLQVLLNSDNLLYWATPETSIEIDTPLGYPMVKSTNLGSGRIPPSGASVEHPLVVHNAVVRGETALVEARFVHFGNTEAVVQVAQSLATVSRAIDEARRTVITVLVIAIAAVIILSIMLAAQAINPINELSRAMREIGFERLDRRLSWPRGDEIGRLAQSFDDLLARLEASFSRERQFISDASHELKTPLTSINANAQMLLRWADRHEQLRRESIETIAHESSSVGEMVEGMLTLARADRGDEIPKEPVSLIEEAREAVRYASPRAREKGLDLNFVQASDSAIVLADAHLIRQMIGNLVDNAIKFTDSGSVDVSVGSENGTGWIEVRDTGPGIDESELARIFERFYRADRSRSRSVPGTGLGLAIVRSIARVHGGSVGAERISKGKGSLFRVTIPLLALCVILFGGMLHGVARADDIPTSTSPIVNVAVSSGTLSVRVWNRPEVRLTPGGAGVHWKHYAPSEAGAQVPSEFVSWAVTVATPQGQAALGAETFSLPSLPPGPHDAVSITSTSSAVVTVPQNTAVIIARVGNGSMTVERFQGTFVGHVRRGAITLHHVTGTAYAQVVAGHIVSVDSNFERVRARTAIGGIFFEGCNVGEIEVTTARGPILFDDGTFTEGPAYFSTSSGSIAIGVASGSATINARSMTHDVALGLSRDTVIEHRADSVTARVNGGGPFVTAIANGAIGIYEGRLENHPAVLSRMPLPEMIPRALFIPRMPRPRGRGRPQARRPLRSRATLDGLPSLARAARGRARASSCRSAGR